MNRIELKQLAEPIGQSLATEKDLATIDAAIADAAKKNSVDPLDYALFKSDVLTAKHAYFVLSTAKLPSEIKAEADAKKTKAAPQT